VVLGNGGILLIDPLGEREYLADLVDALLFLLLVGLAAGVGTCSCLMQTEAGLKGTTDIPALVPMVKAVPHVIKHSPQVLVLPIDPTQVVMQHC
jgi:hypothetical protein